MLAKQIDLLCLLRETVFLRHREVRERNAEALGGGA